MLPRFIQRLGSQLPVFNHNMDGDIKFTKPLGKLEVKEQSRLKALK